MPGGYEWTSLRPSSSKAAARVWSPDCLHRLCKSPSRLLVRRGPSGTLEIFALTPKSNVKSSGNPKINRRIRYMGDWSQTHILQIKPLHLSCSHQPSQRILRLSTSFSLLEIVRGTLSSVLFPLEDCAPLQPMTLRMPTFTADYAALLCSMQHEVSPKKTPSCPAFRLFDCNGLGEKIPNGFRRRTVACEISTVLRGKRLILLRFATPTIPFLPARI